MRIAHLILAHKNPEQLEMLIKALQHPSFEIFLHIDGKSDQSQFTYLTRYPNVRFIRKRTKIYWAGYGTIQGTLNGFEEIIPLNFDYINVLSAQDYPIKTASYIYDFFKAQAGTEFITCESIKDEWKEAASRVHNYHLINFRIPGKYRLEKILTAILPARKAPFGYEFVGRANWFALTNKAADFIYRFQKEHPSYVRYFKLCWGADEFFFSTLLFNTPGFREKIKPNLTYVDWSVIEEKGHPKILDSGDFDKLTRSDKLFARKFDISRDEKIIHKLAEWLNS